MPARLARARDGGQAPGVIHHVIIRGIERREIFRDNKDRNNIVDPLVLLNKLGQQFKKCGISFKGAYIGMSFFVSCPISNA